MFCAHCGRSLLDESLFCEHCGQPVDKPDGALNSIPPTRVTVVSSNASSSRRFLASASVDHSHWKSALKPYLPIIIASAVAILLIGAAIAYAVTTTQHSEDANRTGETAQSETAGESSDAQQEDEAIPGSDADEGQRAADSPDSAKGQAAADSTAEQSPGTALESELTASDYLLPESGSRYYSEAELTSLSDWELYVARNEIFARHGRIFDNQDLREYFESQSWYEPRYTPEEFDALGDTAVNDYERANSQAILTIERNRGSQYAL